MAGALLIALALAIPGAAAAVATPELEIVFTGAFRDAAGVGFTWRVPRSVLTASAVCEELVVVGELRPAGRDETGGRDAGDRGDAGVVDRFRYGVAVASDDAAAVIVFARPLAPGRYRLALELLGCHGEPLRQYAGPLFVPRDAAWAADASGVPLPPPAAGVELVLPAAEPLAGSVTVAARVWGAEVERVEFLLDGEPVATSATSPHHARLRLGRPPRVRELRARAHAADGALLAEDVVVVNRRHRGFALELREPRPGSHHHRSVPVRAALTLPADGELDRLELYLDDRRVLDLHEPPFAVPLALPPAPGPRVVRVVAVLADGRRAEDLALINSPGVLDAIRVTDVALPVTVADRRGRPIIDLEAPAFAVYENGVEQPIARVWRAGELPLALALLIDVSPTMREDGAIDNAVAAAADFLDTVLEPRDRAALYAFREEPTALVPLTGDGDALTAGLERVWQEAETRTFEGTAVLDSVVWSIDRLAAVGGRRALVLLTDGRDNRSRARLADVVARARRANVNVYPVLTGLDAPGADFSRLARETGGRTFRLRHGTGLGQAFRRIAGQLRTQYVVRYRSTHAADDGRCRRLMVAVEGDRPLTARTIDGYCP